MFTLIEKGTNSSINLLSTFQTKKVANICLAMLTFITYAFTTLLGVLAFTMIVMWVLAVISPETFKWLMVMFSWSGEFTHSSHAGVITMAVMQCYPRKDKSTGKINGAVINLRHSEKHIIAEGMDSILSGAGNTVVKYYKTFIDRVISINKDGFPVENGVVIKEMPIDLSKFNIIRRKNTYQTKHFDADQQPIMATRTENILEAKGERTHHTTVEEDMGTINLEKKKVDNIDLEPSDKDADNYTGNKEAPKLSQADIEADMKQKNAEQEERDRAEFEAYNEITVEEELEKKADLSFKHRIGKHIEDTIREKIKEDLKGFISVKVEDVQGGQDIVIEYNGEKIYYVEVKSRWNTQQSIMMSSLQMKKASENKEIYSLCCVDMSGYTTDKGDRYEPPVEVILDRISVLDDIGEKLEPLHKRIHTKNYNEIHITDDYKVVIPQTVVKQGNDDIQYLMDKIKNIID